MKRSRPVAAPRCRHMRFIPCAHALQLAQLHPRLAPYLSTPQRFGLHAFDATQCDSVKHTCDGHGVHKVCLR
eukprot:scaffold36392_cov30-Tisochrysis_lutea.AAC.8